MQVIIQQETTGYGIASCANILGKSYAEIQAVANSIGIFADDQALWSDTQYVRQILAEFGVQTSANEIPFTEWGTLPDLALLAIKHHQENGKNFWHWVVQRIDGKPFVLDSAAYLENNLRQDLDAMQPAWFIEVILLNPIRQP